MKLIALTGKHGNNKFVKVDDEDYDYLNQFKWIVSNQRNFFYVARTVYNGFQIPTSRLLMHREIMKTPKDLVCDHINHDVFDNQKHNLRNCTKEENSKNQRKHPNTLFKYKGYHLKKNKTYEVNITINKRRTYIGCYKTELEAALAYNTAAVKYHGEFACINIIE